MKDFVVVIQVFDGPVGKNHAHAVHEAFPVGGAVEIVDHEEAALEEVVVQTLGFGVGVNVQFSTWTA